MPRLLISYRRADSASDAGRLYDDLVDHFGPDQVFMDIDTIQPGADFVEALQDAVGQADIVLAVIGKRWSSPTSRRRLNDPDDFVRVEIETALARGIRVIPVLVQNAPVPRAEALPETLRPLVRRQAFPLTQLRWRTDIAQLIEAVEPPPPKLEVRDRPQLEEPLQPAQARTPTTFVRRRGVLVAALVAATGGVAGIQVFSRLNASPTLPPAPTPTLSAPAGADRPAGGTGTPAAGAATAMASPVAASPISRPSPPPGATATPPTSAASAPTIEVFATPNFWPGRSSGPPIAVVMHTLSDSGSGTLADADRAIADPKLQASYHYLIGLRGEIHQFVSPDDTAWATGRLDPGHRWDAICQGCSETNPNLLTISIGTEDLGDSNTPVSRLQYDSVLYLVRQAVGRMPRLKWVIGHSALAPQTRPNCPGPRWLISGRLTALARDTGLQTLE